MKHGQLQLQIDKPCTTSWSDMMSIDAGKKFCSSCNKAVIDFTTMPDEELLKFFRENENVCGRLTSYQLNKTFGEVAVRKNNFSLKSLVVIPAFLLSIPVFGQQPKGKPGTTAVVSKTPVIPVSNPKERLITVTGVVSGNINDSLQPVRTVVVITNGRDSVSGFSGRDGNYSLSINCFDSDSLIVSASETWSAEFSETIHPTNKTDSFTVNILLQYQPYHLSPVTYMVGGVTASVGYGKPMSQVRRFFYRLFHPFWRKKLIE